MIGGYATTEATKGQAQKHDPLAYSFMTAPQLTISQAGFGCYRVSDGVPHHAKALRKALCEGINLVDTSANYADGGSEALVGQVLEDLIESGNLARDEVVVVSKVGYLQGQNYTLSRERKQQGRPFPELVEYGEGLEHCIHPEFLRDQLKRSLERLNLETLDFYLLHNPEYYLEWAQKNGQSLEPARSEYYRRIKIALEYLEDEVARGRIRYYGISSNTFPAAADQPDFTCLEKIWQIAEFVATAHHFRLVQLPFNLMEPAAVLEKNQPNDGSVLEFAQQKGLEVLINRPLNAFYNNQLVRLAEVPAFEIQPKDEIVRKIQYLSNWMTSHRQKIEEAFEAVASVYAEEAARQVDRIRQTLAAADRDWAKEGTLSQKALRAVRATPGVSCTLIGMRRVEYVSDVLAELRRPIKQDARIESWHKLTAELAKMS